MVDSRAVDVERVAEAEGVGIAEVEPVQRLGDDDREAPVGGEVHVVRVVDRDRGAGLARPRVDRSEAVPRVVRDVERLQVVGRDDVLRQAADREVRDDPERPRVDDVDRVRLRVRDVEPREGEAGRAAELVRAVGGVDVVRVEKRRHPRARRRVPRRHDDAPKRR